MSNTLPIVHPAVDRIHSLAPGLLLTVGLAILATHVQKISSLNFLSPLIIAIVFGALIRNTIGLPTIYRPGVVFSLKRLLKFSIALLGLQLSFTQVWQIGPRAIAVITIVMLSTFAFTYWLGPHLGVSRNLTKLIAAGTSICGASAIVATGSVIESSDEDMAYAVTIISIFGSLSMLFYPILANLISLSPHLFGLWCGTSIHEVAQVIATAFQGGQVSGEAGTIAKLARVLFLIPTLLVLGMSRVKVPSNQLGRSGRSGQSGIGFKALPVPWFILGFIAFVAINSFGFIPIVWKDAIIHHNRFLIILALAAMGLETDLSKMRQTGLKPLYLGAASWLFIAVLSLALLQYLY
jgi:uncharacterized integral membrane protein (TIGR00698 family)